MNRVDRVKRLAGLDVEPLLSSVLAGGTWLCLGLIAASLFLQRSGGLGNPGDRIHARSLPLLIADDVQHLVRPDAWAGLLLHLAITVLMLTPFVRVVVSLIYMCLVDRDRKHIACLVFVLAVLAVIMFTDRV